MDKKNTEFLNDIKIPYIKDSALFNHQKNTKHPFYCNSIASSIDKSFGWSSSKEGHYFWKSIYESYKYGVIIDKYSIDGKIIKSGDSLVKEDGSVQYILLLKKDKLVEDCSVYVYLINKVSKFPVKTETDLVYRLDIRTFLNRIEYGYYKCEEHKWNKL